MKLNPAKEAKFTKKTKINPLKNSKVMESLNPFVGEMRKTEQKAQADRKASKEKRLQAARSNTARKDASKAFFETANEEGELVF